MLTRAQTGHLKPKQIMDLEHQLVPTQPLGYTQAAKYTVWRQAMSAEFEALQRQGTWTLVPYDPSQNLLGCKWLFKTKYNADGSIARYKARLVAQGFKQEHGLDYHETFSPVAKFATIRVFLTVAINRGWPIIQLDVSNAFLHGTLKEVIHMKQPAGFVDSQYPNHVCLLKKSIYGLKQSPREWFATLSSYMSTYGFKTSSADPSLFLLHKGSTQLYMIIYVDDIILTGNSQTELYKLVAALQSEFSMRNLGHLHQFLGLQVCRTASGLHLNQSQYAKDILQRAAMSHCKPVATQLPSPLPTPDMTDALYDKPEFYRKLVGSLQYLTITHPDLLFAVNYLSQHMHQPYNTNFLILKRVLRYVQGSLTLGLPIYKSNLQLTAFADSDWATDKTDRRSITGYCAFLGDTLISWIVKKQSSVARSSTEAEYRALSTAACDIIWLRRILTEFQVELPDSTKLYCDNVSALALANNPIFHARTKHIEIDFHFIRDCIRSNYISVHHISTMDQPADIFTKALGANRFAFLRDKLTICSAPVTLRGDDKPS
ncbi:Retrovirus-related Pol polyprotein from transposon TNT 1-94 [Dendrobium catenatum]|uniref:Retrovirus-related Pol polyprotein from transposon TNT 1-94 n=1 Tax=Dendrobium catenatum TaxID=906689 RepID=A0A2I0WRK4_9ASPA|nr:Retrovirus-related Pol polyprotein from transposon TNT 1-94 [Dendrobium catenatum]